MVFAAREVASPRRVWSHQRLLVKLSGCHRERPTWFAPGKRLRRTEARCDRRALQSKGPAEKRAEEIHTNTLYHVIGLCGLAVSKTPVYLSRLAAGSCNSGQFESKIHRAGGDRRCWPYCWRTEDGIPTDPTSPTMFSLRDWFISTSPRSFARTRGTPLSDRSDATTGSQASSFKYGSLARVAAPQKLVGGQHKWQYQPEHARQQQNDQLASPDVADTVVVREGAIASLFSFREKIRFGELTEAEALEADSILQRLENELDGASSGGQDATVLHRASVLEQAARADQSGLMPKRSKTPRGKELEQAPKAAFSRHVHAADRT